MLALSGSLTSCDFTAKTRMARVGKVHKPTERATREERRLFVAGAAIRLGEGTYPPDRTRCDVCALFPEPIARQHVVEQTCHARRYALLTKPVRTSGTQPVQRADSEPGKSVVESSTARMLVRFPLLDHFVTTKTRVSVCVEVPCSL
jgi:hypothetical protein